MTIERPSYRSDTLPRVVGKHANLAANEPRNSRAAIASFILGIASVLPLVINSLLAIVLGVIGLKRINKSEGRLKGQGLAIAGITLGVIGAFAWPPTLYLAVQKVRAASDRMTVICNFKQLGLAMHSYNDAKGSLPPAASVDEDGKPLLSWRVAILPYIEQQELYSRFKLDEPWDGPHNKALLPLMPKTFETKSRPSNGSGMTYMQMVTTPPDVEYTPKTCALFGGPNPPRIPASIVDGACNTIVIAEATTAVPWTKPDDLVYRPGGPLPPFGDPAKDFFTVALADGSVRSVSRNTSQESLRRAIVPADGLPIADDW